MQGVSLSRRFIPPTVSLMAQLAVPAVSGFILYLIWLLVRNFFVRSPLDKIPGPPRGSIIAGA